MLSDIVTSVQLIDLLLELLSAEGFISSWVKVLLALITYFHGNI